VSLDLLATRFDGQNSQGADTPCISQESAGGICVARTTIGIDVGTTSVRAVQVRRSRKRIKIVKLAEVPLEPGTVVAGEVRNPAALTEAVKQLWREGRFSSRNVTVGLSGPQTLVRQIDLPWEPDEIFRESLPLRVAADLPINPREMTLDFHPLEIRKRGTALVQRSLIVAAVNVVAENTADALTSAKLKLKRADFSPFALIRTAVLTAGDGKPVPPAPEEGQEYSCEVLVDVGGQITVIAIHDHGRPLFIRVVSGGSESVTSALADNLKLDVDVANAIKSAVGIGMVSPDPATQVLLQDVTPAKQEAAQQIVNMMAGSLVQVVRESVEYFLAVSPGVSGVDRILLSGGGSLLPGFGDRLSSELRAPVAMLNPVQALAKGKAAKKKDLDPRMNVAIGLALGAE
jgi:type IV pilus assembly protein PilM